MTRHPVNGCEATRQGKMNPIRGNLRMVLSQPWAVWVLFIGGVAVYWLLILLEVLGVWNARSGALTPCWWWTQVLIFGGISMGGAGRHDALATPLSFALPGYRESLRRASFVRAARWGVVFALFLFSHIWSYRQLLGDWSSDVPKPSFMMGPSIAEVSLNMVGGFLAGMVICLFWVNNQLLWSRRNWSVILLTVGTIGIAYVAMLYGARHPFVVWPILIPSSVFFCGFFWWRLGDMEWVKDGHRGTLVRKTGGSWGIEVRTTVVSCKIGGAREPDARTTASSWWRDLFLGAMRKGNSTAAARHVWGCFYRVFGPTFSQWKWIVVSLLAGVLVLGYLDRLLVGMAFLFLGLPIAGEVWQLSSTMLLPEGRREKSYLTIASGTLATLLLMGISTGVVVLSWVFAALLPPVSLGMFHLQYAGFSMRNVWLACLPVPWFPIMMLVIAMVVLGLRFVLPFLLLLFVLFSMGRGLHDFHVGPILLPTLLPILLACGWAFFLLMGWIKYQRWDLADE
jgi:hypothetical protein